MSGEKSPVIAVLPPHLRPAFVTNLQDPPVTIYTDGRITTRSEPPAEVQQDDERHAGVVREATDLCWKATPYALDESGSIASYLLPAGVVHRLLGQLQAAGHPAAFRQAALAARPSADTETLAELVLIHHQRRDIKGCSCGEWGSDHGHMGQSHPGHVIERLRAAGIRLALEA